MESAGIGASAHLVSFRGSDTIAGSVVAQRYYDAWETPGLSIPATEHSICTLLGEAGELDVYKHLLQQFPTGMVACVSDSYDIFRACREYWGGELKSEVLERDGVLVIRPDSGDPVKTVLAVFDILFDKFGYSTNEKGYKVLPPQVRMIQGDGVHYESIIDLFEALKKAGISAENLALGMGGALLQKLDRDTQQFALKCSHAVVNGKEVAVQKRPVEMNAVGELHESFKRSKAGRLKLIKTASGFETVSETAHPSSPDEMVTVFENGKIVKEWSFAEVRRRAAAVSLEEQGA
ncbi:MAG: hypothetical protein AAFO69_04670 [Bacteroidota bacterium]